MQQLIVYVGSSPVLLQYILRKDHTCSNSLQCFSLSHVLLLLTRKAHHLGQQASMRVVCLSWWWL
jgi:hypothetical protein